MENGIKLTYPYIEVEVIGTNYIMRFIRAGDGETGTFKTSLEELKKVINDIEKDESWKTA